MAEETENKKIELNLDFESIVPWNGQQDTGRDVRLKLDRNWQKVIDAFNFLLGGGYLDSLYLRKDQDDRSIGTIASDKGFEAGKFIPETGGAACYQDKDGNWHIETDHLRVRKKFTATEIEVQEVHHVGGQMLLTAADMIVDYVYEMTDRYRCYYLKKDSDGREVKNLWKTGDQAYCSTFNLTKQADGTTGNHYLWRLVLATNLDAQDSTETRTFGDVTIRTSDYNFVDLSKDVCAVGSDAPLANDEIVHLGYQPDGDSDRRNAIVIAGAGSGSPYIYEFTGINSFVLPEPETRIKPGDNLFTGMMRIKGGSTGAKNLEDFPDEVFRAVHVGAVNLLLNSGFTGDYQTEDLTASSSLQPDSEMFSKALEHWTGTATINDDTSAVSGRAATIGSLSQSVKVISGENYVVSFRAKGSQVNVACGSYSVSQVLDSTSRKYAFKFVSDGNGVFSISGDATVCDLQLERGTIATDWTPSPQDDNKSLAEFQAIQYLRDAIQEGDTSILGGLILSSLIMLGNYKDGVMQKVNAGMSGIYNDDDDVAFWGGGTFEQAIATVMKFKENPNYQPELKEWSNLANFVVTHGGDLFLRGTILAENGYFRGRLEQGNNKTVLERDGSGHLANGTIEWTPEGIMYRRSPDVIRWVQLSEFSARTVTFDKGTYLDISIPLVMDTNFNLSNPSRNNFSIVISFRDMLSRQMIPAVLSASFCVYDKNTHTQKYVGGLTLSDSTCISGAEVKLTYVDGYWTVPDADVYVNEDTSVAYVGAQSTFTAESATIETLESTEITSTSMDATRYYVDGERGETDTVIIYGTDGKYRLEFNEGLLVSSSFTANEGE